MPSSESGYDELRVALVMTGGVSLAVWMGGVTNEVNRLLHGAGLYGELLDLLQYTPRVDVITGSSAGGLNGALLATAIANGQDLSHVREIWADNGGLATLMRSPFDRAATSLLEGEKKFLPALQDAFASLVGGLHPFQAEFPLREPDSDLQLTVTTTLLTGELHTFSDDFGSLISEPDYRGEFHFERLSGDDVTPDSVGASGPRNDFVGDNAPARLARAVRCSASFPGAFEASYSPGSASAPVDGVDMAGIANFSRAQFTVDGGVLVNKPVQGALDRIYLQSATRPVRRVLAYVNPLPSDVPLTPPGDGPTPPAPPNLGAVLGKALVGVRGVESLARNFQELQDHNRRVRDLRKSLDALALSVGDDHRRLPALARPLYEAYRTTREEGAVAHVVGCILSKGPENTRARVYDIHTLEQLLAEAMREGGGPWIPPDWAGDELPIFAADEWRWGIYGVEGIAGTVLSMLGRAQTVERVNRPGQSSLEGYKAAVHRVIGRAAALRLQDREHWENGAADAFNELATLSSPASDAPTRREARDALVAWAADKTRSWLTPRGRSAIRAAAVQPARQLIRAREQILEIVQAVAENAPASVRSEASAIQAMLDMLAPANSTRDDCLRNLLALEVLQGALHSPDRGLDNPVELFQVSAVTPNALLRRTIPRPEDKLTGAQLFHFGAFYKRSWRYNDWIWGRQDGAMRMIQLLLDPERFAQIVKEKPGSTPLSERACEVLHTHAIANETNAGRRDFLATYWENDKQEVLHELAFLDDPALPPPSSLPRCTRTLARRLQLEIACREMPMVCKAEAADAEDQDGRLRPILAQPEFKPAVARDALEACDIGKQRIVSEVGTNRFLDSTTRAAVLTTAAVQNSAGEVPGAKRVLRPLRGLTLAIYWVTAGITQNSPGATAALLGVLAVSGAVLTVVLASGDYTRVPAVVALVAVAGALVGMTVWARKIGYELITIAILVAVAICAALLTFPTFDSGARHDALHSALLIARPFLLGVILIGGLMVLGGAGSRVKPIPPGTQTRIRRAISVVLVFAWIAIIVGAVIGGDTVLRALFRVRDERNAGRTEVALLSPAPVGAVPSIYHVGRAAPSTDLTGFATVPVRPDGLYAHLDLGIVDPAGGVLHAWVFRKNADAQHLFDTQTAGASGSPPCVTRSGRVVCWERDGRVDIASSSTAGEASARDLLAVGRTLVASG